jgi:hypothetical protein
MKERASQGILSDSIFAFANLGKCILPHGLVNDFHPQALRSGDVSLSLTKRHVNSAGYAGLLTLRTREQAELLHKRGHSQHFLYQHFEPAFILFESMRNAAKLLIAVPTLTHSPSPCPNPFAGMIRPFSTSSRHLMKSRGLSTGMVRASSQKLGSRWITKLFTMVI